MTNYIYSAVKLQKRERERGHMLVTRRENNSISNLTSLKICMQKFIKYSAHILDICGKCPTHKNTLFHWDIRQCEHLHCFWKEVVCTICEMIGVNQTQDWCVWCSSARHIFEVT